jgi:hypothetical protein
MSSEIIQIVAYDNYEYFQHANFIISQIFISTILRIIYWQNWHYGKLFV